MRSRLWVTCEGTKAVVDRVWTTGQEISHMLVPTPDGRSNTVTLFDTAGRKLLHHRQPAGRHGLGTLTPVYTTT